MFVPSRRDLTALLVAAPVLAPSARARAATALGSATPPTTWDLGGLYPSDAAWETALNTATSAIAQLDGLTAALRPDDVHALEAALGARSDCRRAVQRLGAYAQLKGDVNLTHGADQDRRVRADALAGTLDQASTTLDAGLMRLGQPQVFAMLDVRPELARFRYPLRRVFRAADHAPPPAAAALLASAHALLKSPEGAYHQLIAAVPRPSLRLSDGREVELGQRTYSSILESPVRADRIAAHTARAATLRPFAPTFAATLAAYVEGCALQARAAGYGSVQEAVLMQNGIPTAVLATAIRQARESLPLLRRYVDLRRRKLGVDRLSLADFSVPLTRARPAYDLAKMRVLLLQAVEPLGPEYQRTLSAATMDRWMDVFARPGKAQGGYTNYDAYGVHPYILFNLSNDYQSLSEFCHEWGHAMNAVLTDAAQPFELSDLAAFATEVAATCHEQLLVRDRIARASNGDERTYYLWRKALFQVGFFHQTMMKTELEQAIHERIWTGQGVSADDLNGLWLNLLKTYWGEGVEIDDDDGLGWISDWQLFDAYYNFQYATSITGAVHFATALRTGDGVERARYLSFLSAGGSDDAYALLRTHGLDLADPAPYRAFAADLSATLDALASP